MNCLDELFARSNYCYVHVPKTGGTSIEKACGFPHAHQPARGECTRVFLNVRDPVNRLASAYHFCKEHPWDTVLRKRTWGPDHCCHSSVVKRLNLSEWIIAVVNDRMDCRMPGAGYPLPFTSPTRFWLAGYTGNITYLRTSCLDHDVKVALGVHPRHHYKSNNRDCPTITTDAWHSVGRSEHAADFQIVYGRSFSSIHHWSRVCVESTCAQFQSSP